MPKQKKRVLIAEDDIFIMEIYVLKLSSGGFEVISAKDGKEALEKIENEKLDLIILDLLMPKMDGRELLKKIKSQEKFKNIPVLILTNVGEQDSVKEVLDLGASDYLIKSSFTPDEVVEKVKEYI